MAGYEIIHSLGFKHFGIVTYIAKLFWSSVSEQIYVP